MKQCNVVATKKTVPTRIYKVDWGEAKELLLDLKIFNLHRTLCRYYIDIGSRRVKPIQLRVSLFGSVNLSKFFAVVAQHVAWQQHWQQHDRVRR